MAATGSHARTAAPSSLLIAQLARGTRRRIEEAVAHSGSARASCSRFSISGSGARPLSRCSSSRSASMRRIWLAF